MWRAATSCSPTSLTSMVASDPSADDSPSRVPGGAVARAGADKRELLVQAQREGRLGRGIRQLVLGAEPADCRSGSEELGGVLAPDVVQHRNVDAHDAGCR